MQQVCAVELFDGQQSQTIILTLFSGIHRGRPAGQIQWKHIALDGGTMIGSSDVFFVENTDESREELARSVDHYVHDHGCTVIRLPPEIQTYLAPTFMENHGAAPMTN